MSFPDEESAIRILQQHGFPRERAEEIIVALKATPLMVETPLPIIR